MSLRISCSECRPLDSKLPLPVFTCLSFPEYLFQTLDAKKPWEWCMWEEWDNQTHSKLSIVHEALTWQLISGNAKFVKSFLYFHCATLWKILWAFASVKWQTVFVCCVLLQAMEVAIMFQGMLLLLSVKFFSFDIFVFAKFSCSFGTLYCY